MPTPTPADIAAAAMKPKSISTDGTSVTLPSAQEQIDAATFEAANRKGKKPRRGMAFSRLVPGSAVGPRS